MREWGGGGFLKKERLERGGGKKRGSEKGRGIEMEGEGGARRRERTGIIKQILMEGL